MDWGYITTAIALLLNVLSFFGGRKSAAHDDGERDGNVMTKLDSICDSVNKIENRISNIESQNGELRDRITRLETKMEFYKGGGCNG